MPTTDSGRWVAAPIWVIGMAEVLVASTASGPQIRSRMPNSSRLTARSSKTASTTMSASAAASSSVVVRDPAQRGLRVLLADPALAGEPGQRLLDAVQAALQRLRR